jgi:hypothetical protein
MYFCTSKFNGRYNPVNLLRGADRSWADADHRGYSRGSRRAVRPPRLGRDVLNRHRLVLDDPASASKLPNSPAGSISTRPTTCSPPTATSSSPGAATTTTSVEDVLTGSTSSVGQDREGRFLQDAQSGTGNVATFSGASNRSRVRQERGGQAAPHAPPSWRTQGVTALLPAFLANAAPTHAPERFAAPGTGGARISC